MTTVVGYSRVSTSLQVDDGISLDAQAARIRQWCEQHGHAPPILETDEGLSGKRADNRPALQRALDRVCDEQGILVVYSLSRLCRSTRDALDIAERVKKAGAHLVSLTENIDTTNAIGEFFFTLMAALAQLERRLIGDRTREALAHKRRTGMKTGGHCPYGYSAQEGRLIADPDEQRVLAQILRDCKGGKGFSMCATMLNRTCVPTRTGTAWSARVVRQIWMRESAREAI